MSVSSGSTDGRRLRRWAATPVAGALAGILFAVSFAVSVTIIQQGLNDEVLAPGAWLDTYAGRLRFAVGLAPFAGLFFLWFIAVARQRLGRFEDQFFSTIFLGSGLLFLVLVLTAAALAGAHIATYTQEPSAFARSTTYAFSRNLIAEIYGTYALRMAAVFQISQAMLWLRTGVLPRWMAFVTLTIAAVLLFVVTEADRVVLVFPAWVLLVSLYILVTHVRTSETELANV